MLSTGRMIRFRLLELLEERGKSLYWLRKETGVSYPALLRYAHNKVRKPDLEIVEKICRALDCKPGDLLMMKDG